MQNLTVVSSDELDTQTISCINLNVSNTLSLPNQSVTNIFIQNPYIIINGSTISLGDNTTIGLYTTSQTSGVYPILFGSNYTTGDISVYTDSGNHLTYDIPNYTLNMVGGVATGTFTATANSSSTISRALNLYVQADTGNNNYYLIGTSVQSSAGFYSIHGDLSGNLYFNPSTHLFNIGGNGNLNVGTTGIFGGLLTASNGFTLSSGTLTLPSSSITNGMLVNSSFSLGGTSISLGSTITNLSSLTINNTMTATYIIIQRGTSNITTPSSATFSIGIGNNTDGVIYISSYPSGIGHIIQSNLSNLYIDNEGTSKSINIGTITSSTNINIGSSGSTISIPGVVTATNANSVITNSNNCLVTVNTTSSSFCKIFFNTGGSTTGFQSLQQNSNVFFIPSTNSLYSTHFVTYGGNIVVQSGGSLYCNTIYPTVAVSNNINISCSSGTLSLNGLNVNITGIVSLPTNSIALNSLVTTSAISGQVLTTNGSGVNTWNTLSSITNSNNIYVSSTTSNINYPMTFCTYSTNGFYPLYSDISLFYNPSTAVLHCNSLTSTGSIVCNNLTCNTGSVDSDYSYMSQGTSSIVSTTVGLLTSIVNNPTCTLGTINVGTPGIDGCLTLYSTKPQTSTNTYGTLIQQNSGNTYIDNNSINSTINVGTIMNLQTINLGTNSSSINVGSLPLFNMKRYLSPTFYMTGLTTSYNPLISTIAPLTSCYVTIIPRKLSSYIKLTFTSALNYAATLGQIWFSVGSLSLTGVYTTDLTGGSTGGMCLISLSTYQCASFSYMFLVSDRYTTLPANIVFVVTARYSGGTGHTVGYVSGGSNICFTAEELIQ